MVHIKAGSDILTRTSTACMCPVGAGSFYEGANSVCDNEQDLVFTSPFSPQFEPQ